MFDEKVVAAEVMSTGWCPHDCSYCYLPKTSEMREMHRDIVENLDKLLRKTDEVFDGIEYLGFWGTEPLLTLGQFDVEEINDRFPELKEVSFSTSLLGHADVLTDFIDEADQYDFDVDFQVSIDGPYTNANREPDAVERIKRNLVEVLEQTDSSFSLQWKSTITPDNIRDMNENGVAKYYDFFEELNEFVEEHLSDRVKFNNSFAPTLMVPGRYTSQDGKDFALFLQNLHQSGHDSTYTYRLKRFFDPDYMDQITKRPHTATCSGGDSQYGFDGKEAHICHRTFYLNRQEYVESVEEQNQEENWDVSHFKSGTIEQIQDEFIADVDDDKDMTRFQYIMQNYHDYWGLKLALDKALMIELADVGQIDQRYGFDGEDGARDLFALFLNAAMSCPVESVMNTNTLFMTPVSLIRMFGNGAMQELEKRVLKIT